MASEHIVRSFDEELQRLRGMMSRMAGLTEAQLDSAIQAVMRRDAELAEAVVGKDGEIDALEREIDQSAVRILALRQPMAVDLRNIVGTLKIASDVERIGDLAKNIAKRTIAIHQSGYPARPGIQRMGRLVQAMVKDVLDAHMAGDAAKAIAVWRRDEEVDDIYTSLFREHLTYMMEDPRTITASTHYLFIAKNLERIGDHATNIAETVHFAVNGSALAETRPKGDQANYAVVPPPADADTGKAKAKGDAT